MKQWIVFIIFMIVTTVTNGQSEKFEQGKKAYLANNKIEALKLLNSAVHHEKFLMKGKEIPFAYAYMAIIKNEHVSNKLKSGNIQLIINHPGMLNNAISDVSNAIKFQEGSSKQIVNKASKQLIKNAMAIGHMVSDSLMKLDFNIDIQESKSLASMLKFELKNLSQIDNENWELHDMIGLSYYILEEKDLAMLEFKRARDIYNLQESNELSNIHLYNCMYSSKHHYKVTQNYPEAYLASIDGQNLIKKMMTNNDDSMEEIKRLVSIEGTFSSIQNRIENMNVLSSTKE